MESLKFWVVMAVLTLASVADPSIPSDHAKELKKKCRELGSIKLDMDTATSDVFDSKYFDMLAAREGLLVSNHVLWDDNSTCGLVQENRKREAFLPQLRRGYDQDREI